MINNLKSLIWLRTQQLITNSQYLLLLVLPLLFLYLYKFLLPKADGIDEYILTNSLSMFFGVSLGPIVSMIIAEEKDKHNIKELKMAGIEGPEYILGSLFHPVILGIIGIVVIPMLIGNISLDINYMTYFIVSILTAMVIIFLNLFIGLLTKNQSEAQIFSVPIMLSSMLLPMLSSFNDQFSTFNTYFFMGSFTQMFTTEPGNIFKTTEFVSLLMWLLVTMVINIVAYNLFFKGKNQMEKMTSKAYKKRGGINMEIVIIFALIVCVYSLYLSYKQRKEGSCFKFIK